MSGSGPVDTPFLVDEDHRGRERERWRGAVRQILFGNVLIVLLAILLALVVGSILIAVTDPRVGAASGYFFARPGDTFAAIWAAISDAYVAFFHGAVYDFRKSGFAEGIRPLTETFTFATPLIIAGLGIGLTFKAGLFNIGGRGQMLMGGIVGGWVGFALPLPPVIHPIVAVLVGIAAGAAWGAIAGILKAYTGAHEVIVTIMLNYVAYYIVFWMLSTKGLLQAPGSINAKSQPELPTAILPELFGPGYRLHAGFILALAAVIVVWWLMERSSLGFRMRAVGENPHAARTAGIDVKKTTVVAMLLSGGLVGLAGVNQALGTETGGLTAGLDAGIGFDAITVALLGRSRPFGVLAAGVLFGAFKAGGFSMQAAAQVPIDIITVVQALIVLFVAAPPLIRAIFRLPQPGAKRLPTSKAVKA